MESVAFYSYKGGVGRSLLLVNTARFLALSGRRVVALDLDFEAPGLHYKTGVEGRVKTGAVRLLQRSLDGDLPTLDEVREAAVEVPMPATHGGWLRLIAAGPAPKAEYWADLSRLHEVLVANQDAGLLEAVLDLQVRIEEAWSPDVLLVDARTGVTGLGGIVTMALCDRVVLMTTRAMESLDGIRAVAESLRATPTLRGGERRLEFVVSRVQGTEAVDEKELREVLGEYFELPHDRYDGGAERLLGDGPPSQATSWWGRRSVVDSLHARTLTWLSTLFPSQKDVATRARNRLVAVEEARQELTDPSTRTGAMTHERWYWSPDMLAHNVEFFAPDGSKRMADIVATLASGEQAMIIEHIDDEPDATVMHWWSERAPGQVIVLQWHEDAKWPARRRMFLGRGVSQDGNLEVSDRWGLPAPVEFELLHDPTDDTVATVLEIVPRTRFYDERVIIEWVRNNPFGHLTVSSFQSEQARKIVDGLAAIEEVKRAKEIVAACAQNASSRSYRLPTADGRLDRLLQEGLCAPLCWRIPPRAFTELAKELWYYALRRLAGFLGLDYDPDAALRRVSKPVDDDVAAQAFLDRERKFEWSTDPLPVSLPTEDVLSAAESRPPGYHGHLGTYTPGTGRIVLAGPTIEAVAESLGRAPRYVGSVTLLHLSVLGMLHNGIDLDGQRWEGFSTDPLSPVTIALAQLFVHRFIVELADERLQDAFDALTDVQPPEYGAWRAMTHVSLEDVRAWMMSIRRGTDGPAPVDLDSLLRPR